MEHSSMLHELLRAEDVTRWNMVRTTRQQNVAEHSFAVALIAVNIAQRVGLDHQKVAYLALMHDIDEVWTGDIPSVTKAELRKRGADWKTMEMEPDPGYKTHGHVVKAADFIESIRFIETYGHGPHAAEVARRLREDFETFLGRYIDGPFRKTIARVAEEARRTDFVIQPEHWSTKR